MHKTYLFYDLETSGINKCFDQILQFAAIRCDENLNEIERYEFLVKLNPDTIPSPRATITHHISIEKASHGLSEYEAVKRIYALVNTPNTVSIGYNTLGFDDEFLRFSFFKNLFPPYDHQYKNGCRRMDLYPITAAYSLFAEDVLTWPENEAHKTSLKLEHLNCANHLYSGGRAHDAMTDVIVTLELARAFKRHHLQMWQYLAARFDKAEDQKVLSQLDSGLTIDATDYKQALMISGKFGGEDQFMAPVLSLGQHWHYKNQWCFLCLDLPELQKATSASFKDCIWTVNKKWGDVPFLLPAKARFLKKFNRSRLDVVRSNKAFLSENPAVFTAIRNEVLDYKHPEVENVDVDAALYQSKFMSDAEAALCARFHQADTEQKVALVKEMPQSYAKRALRILGRLSPEHLPKKMQGEFQGYLEQIASYDEQSRPIDYKGEYKLSIMKACEEIQTLIGEGTLNDEQIALLNELEAYLTR